MSSRDPLWYCHQCHAEMRPLMTPDPTCASCRGTFVEKLDNPVDDPRDLQNRSPTAFNFPNHTSDTFDDFFGSALWPRNGNSPSNSSPHRPRSPPTQRSHDNTPSSSGVRFEFHTGPGGSTTRTFYLGGSNNLRRSRSPPTEDQSAPTALEFLRREVDPHTTNPRNSRAQSDIAGPLMAQYLLTLFGGSRDARVPGDPFTELLGMPPSTRWGDYVFNQEALDQILTQLAENSTAGRPVPATADIMDDLPREVLTEGSPLLDKDCAVCKESFSLNPEDPDDSVVITLPCKHPFHEGCIIPWLKSSGTCPVCRHALIAQPQQSSPGGPSGGSSTSNRTNPPSSRPPQSGNSDMSGASHLFHSLFGGGGGPFGGNSDASSARTRNHFGRANRSTQPEVIPQSTPPFPGRWIEDVD